MWLKRRTPQNIVIGGAAGAFPPVIGWAAVTGTVDLVPLVLFGIVFIWTPPHFWSLALWANDDYRQRRRADAAGGGRREGNPAADLALHAGAGAADPGALLHGLQRRASTAWPRPCSGWCSCSAFTGAADRQDAAGVSLTNDAPAQGSVQILDLLSVRPVRRAGPRPARWLAMAPRDPPRADAETPRRCAPPPRPQLGHPDRLLALCALFYAITIVKMAHL